MASMEVERDYWRERAEQAEAEVERLRADRAALLGLLIFETNDGWQIRGAAFDCLPYVYPTRETAEGLLLAWTKGREQ